MSQEVKWNVEEAYKQNYLDRGRYVPEPDTIPENKITDADRYLLRVAKETEGLPDEERVKHIHCALGKCVPFLNETFVMKFPTDKERCASISDRLVKAYKIWRNENCIKSDPVLFRGLKALNFLKFSRENWYDLLDLMEYVSKNEYDEDMSEIHNAASFFYKLAIMKDKAKESAKKAV